MGRPASAKHQQWNTLRPKLYVLMLVLFGLVGLVALADWLW